MKRQWSTLVVLAGSLVFLASLYLPWQQATCNTQSGSSKGPGDVAGLLNLFSSSCQTIDPLPFGGGSAAALTALALAALAVIALVRPQLEDRLPIGTSALAMGYFATALTQTTASWATRFQVFGEFHTASGTFIGVAAAALAFLSAAVPRRRELFWDRSALSLVRLGLVGCYLATLLLPWHSSTRNGHAEITVLGIEGLAGTLAAGCVLVLPLVWWRADGRSRVDGIPLAATAALLTGAAITIGIVGLGRTVVPWVAAGLALALLASAAAGGRPVTPWLSFRTAIGAASLSAFIVGMFLPWQQACGTEINKALSHRCISENGWTTATTGSTAAALAIALFVVLWIPGHLHVLAVELAAGFGLLVATAGFGRESLRGPGDYRLDVAYGSTVAFVGAAALVLLALAGVRLSPLDRLRILERAIPIAAAISYIGVIVVPWWDILPERVESALYFPPFSWPTMIAEALIGVHLLGYWVRRAADPVARRDWLVALPLFLLALAALDVIMQREAGITWRGGIVVGLCLLLAFFGYAERRGGLRKLRIPEILRVDRISEP